MRMDALGDLEEPTPLGLQGVHVGLWEDSHQHGSDEKSFALQIGKHPAGGT